VVSALAGQLGLDALACAEGIVRVAEAEMLGALRLMTVERGVDPREFALLPFGGAGPLHAAALAEQLGMTRVLCPRASGVLSALGLAAAAPRHDVSQTVLLGGESLSSERLHGARQQLLARAARTLDAEQPTRARVRYELRYRGQSFELPVEEELAWHERQRPRLDPDGVREAFARAHERRYGYRDEQTEVELVNVRASVWGAAPRPLPAAGAHEGTPADGTRGRRRVIFDGEQHEATLLRGELPAGLRVAGPALCALPEATLLVPPGWQGHVDAHGNVRLHRGEGA
jgi:N-methylhydantoinase A